MIKVLIAGDFCPRYRVAEELSKKNWGNVFGDIRELISQMDFSIVNFECAVALSETKPINKYGPNLKCEVNAIEALKWLGVKCVTLANNHFNDYGDEGVNATISALNTNGVLAVGGGHNITEASKTLYHQICGYTLAIINCCEHEFNIATEKSGGSNPINPIKQYYAIKEAKSRADFVLVIVHGGHEHYPLPSVRMQDTYRFFIDIGADAVVNHHQHCYSGYESYKGKPIFYGLGNFCFDNPKSAKKYSGWSYGFLLELDFMLSETKFQIYPYEQSTISPKVTLLNLGAFTDRINVYNRIIQDRNLLIQSQNHYYSEEEKEILSAFQPFCGRWAYLAHKLKLLPSFMTKKWSTVLYNMIMCEAHHDKVEFFLNKLQK